MGLSPEEFYRSDPSEFAAAYEAHNYQTNQQYLISGTIIASIYNQAGVKKQLVATDIFPHLIKALNIKDSKKTMSADQLLSVMDSVIALNNQEDS